MYGLAMTGVDTLSPPSANCLRRRSWILGYAGNYNLCLLTFFLRSELLACVGLLRCQMNKTIWDVWKQEFVGWELNAKCVPIKVKLSSKETCSNSPTLHANSCLATQVAFATFTNTQACVAQASCDPSSSSPSLHLTLQASYLLGDRKTGYSQDRARNILRWLLGSDGPSHPSSPDFHGSPRGDARAAVGEKMDAGVRLPSGSSYTSPGSLASTAATDSSKGW